MEENNQTVEEKNPLEERVKNLVSDKKVAEEKALDLENKLAQAEKETNFLNQFSDSIAKYPSAPEYKDKIKEKVMAGYSMEDATISILHSEGKLIPNQKPVERENVAGGSASTQITNQSQKPIQEMDNKERWAALREEEKKGNLGMV